MNNTPDRHRSFEELRGKTIASIALRKHSECDDLCYLDLVCTDGTSMTIVSTYGKHTGNSLDEYPTGFKVCNLGYEDRVD